MIEAAGLEDKFKKLKTMPLHLGAFVLSNSIRNMDKFLHAINEFYKTMFITLIPTHYTLKIIIRIY